MAGGVFDGGSPGQETPSGFQDSTSQWLSANDRQRTTFSQPERDVAQCDSQCTQVLTEVENQSLAPSFVDTLSVRMSNDEKGGITEELQICLPNIENQNVVEAPDQLIVKDKVLDPTSPARNMYWSFDKAKLNDSDDDADSSMSDDMLEHGGCATRHPATAAYFQTGKKTVITSKWYDRPHNPDWASSRSTLLHDSDSSGNETEIEAEPKENSLTDCRIAKTYLSLEPAEDIPRSGASQSGKYSSLAAKCRHISADAIDQRRPLSSPIVISNARSSPHAFTWKDSSSPQGIYPIVKRSRLDRERTHLDYLNRAENVSSAKICELKHLKGHQHQENISHDTQTDNDSPSTIVVAKQKDTLLKPKYSPNRHLVPAATRGKMRIASSRLRENSQTTGTQASTNVRIVLTGLEPTPAVLTKIKAITGAVYESNIVDATHLIAPHHQFKRTVKMLCGISCCKHILDERWLDESARAGAPVDERSNCLYDEKAEKRWHFLLETTMYDVSAEQRRKLLAGLSVFITNHKSILPPVKDLVKIVECAGGKASYKGKPMAKDLVITSDVALSGAAVRKQLVNTPPDQLYTSEIILSSILRQEIELHKHRLNIPDIGAKNQAK